jgi:hydroxymethylpyrimidine pyrophosphatase-like HAD family hydrolase
VSTYLAPPTAADKKQPSYQTEAIFRYSEDVLRQFTDHLHSYSKSLLLEEDHSFLQEQLTRKFFESPAIQISELLNTNSPFKTAIEAMKNDFDGELRKMMEHIAKKNESIVESYERKLEVLKKEASKSK